MTTNENARISAIELASQLRGNRELAKVLPLARTSLLAGQPRMDWLLFALDTKNADPVLAEAIMSLLVEIAPDFAATYYELAFAKRLRGEHREASWLLHRSLALVDGDVRSRLFLAHMLYAQGARPEGDRVIASAAPGDQEERRDLDAMIAFGRYLERFPFGRALVKLDQLNARSSWLNPEQLATEIGAAVAAKRPFAFVRFGDGEGGVIRIDALDDQRYRPLYDQNRQELISMWFGDAFEWRTNGFFQLASNLIEETQDCDVIGVPYESWLRHEYSISSLRGVPSLTNVYRALLASNPGRRLTICSQLSHVELANKGYLAQILKAAGKISVISCFEQLPALLKERLGLAEVTLHQIPGEQGSRHILGEDATRGSHYPERFNQLQAELATPHDGRVFLISAGLLGKIYAATIRRHGGIALDVGSIVDNWTGHNTRPGYDEKIRL